jgi:hypothetical protein
MSNGQYQPASKQKNSKKAEKNQTIDQDDSAGTAVTGVETAGADTVAEPPVCVLSAGEVALAVCSTDTGSLINGTDRAASLASIALIASARRRSAAAAADSVPVPCKTDYICLIIHQIDCR